MQVREAGGMALATLLRGGFGTRFLSRFLCLLPRFLCLSSRFVFILSRFGSILSADKILLREGFGTRF